MFDKAFASTQNALQGRGHRRVDRRTRAIVHEIGHAIDLVGAAEGERRAREGRRGRRRSRRRKYPDPDKPASYRYAKGGPEEADVDAVLKAQKDAETGALTTSSLSGRGRSRSRTAASRTRSPRTAKGNTFREAATKDGAKAVDRLRRHRLAGGVRRGVLALHHLARHARRRCARTSSPTSTRPCRSEPPMTRSRRGCSRAASSRSIPRPRRCCA